jgi:uncharacterized membrane protein
MQAVPVRTPELSLSLEQAFPARPRLHSVDLLRGLVMVLMALDTVRAYFSPIRVEPTGLSELSAGLFLTRLATHLCAPVFVLLAGAGTYLALANGVPRREQARFLAVRGLGLILLELTVVRLLWTFNLDYAGQPLVLHAIAALGVCMVALAGLLALPVTVVAGMGIAIIAGHNLLDGLDPAALGAWSPIWRVLHVPGPVELPGGISLVVIYPVLPWVGVIAVGYALGAVLTAQAETRRRTLVRLGVGLTLAFLVLRAWNGYGDPAGWTIHTSTRRSLLSFFDATKYPPSLLFLLMTLGPSLLLLVAADAWRGVAGDVLALIGRVPLFYYLLHLGVIHTLALIIGTLAGFEPGAFLTAWPFLPRGWGYGLPVIFAVWAAVVLALYPACRWFAAVKAGRPDSWLRYL